MELSLDLDSLLVYKALSAETRLIILDKLAQKPQTSSELAQQMNLSKAIISRHLKVLEEASLISLLELSEVEEDNRKKIYSLSVDKIEIHFPQQIYLLYKKKSHEIALGYFSDFSVQPSCGLASPEKVIGKMDDLRSFVSNERVDASLLGFSDGYVEYIFPNPLEASDQPELLDISLELSSEFPVSNNNWPSDISFYINDVKVGTWTAKGNYSDVRGRLTPDWWDSRFSQYGMLKHLRINTKDTGIDGEQLSIINLSDLKLQHSPFIKFRIGVDKEAKNKGGLTIFGRHFGNYPQNIVVDLYYSQKEKH